MEGVENAKRCNLRWRQRRIEPSRRDRYMKGNDDLFRRCRCCGECAPSACRDRHREQRTDHSAARRERAERRHRLFPLASSTKPSFNQDGLRCGFGSSARRASGRSDCVRQRSASSSKNAARSATRTACRCRGRNGGSRARPTRGAANREWRAEVKVQIRPNTLTAPTHDAHAAPGVDLGVNVRIAAT